MARFILLALLIVGKLCAEGVMIPLSDCSENACPCCSEMAPYISIGGGVVFPSKNSSIRGDSSSVLFQPTSQGTSLFSLPNVIWKNQYQTGYEVFGAFGISLSPCFRAEGEFLYQNFKRKISGSFDWREINACTTVLFDQNTGDPISHASTKTHIYALLSNFYFDYRTCTPLTLTLGGGVGVAWINSNRTVRNNVLRISTMMPPLNEMSPTIEKSPKLEGTAFAWQVKAGLKYDLFGCLSLGLNYRLFGTTRFVARTSKIIANPGTSAETTFEIPRNRLRGLLNNCISLSADYHF